MSNPAASRPRVHLIANAKSGKGAGADVIELARDVAREAGVELVEHALDRPEEIDATIKRAVADAKRGGDRVIAAGGDGTLRSVAELVHAAELPFGAVALGTFNFFARTHELPEDPREALRVAMLGRLKPVRIGEFNGRTFLINASLGLYAKSIEEREEATARFGRARLVVILSTVKTLLKPHRLLDAIVSAEGSERRLRTPMIFVGNNSLQLKNLEMPVAECLERDLLAVVTLKPVRGLEMLRVLARGLARTLQNEERVQMFCTEELKIESRRAHQSVALDGETFDMESPFVVKALPGALRLAVPT